MRYLNPAAPYSPDQTLDVNGFACRVRRHKRTCCYVAISSILYRAVDFLSSVGQAEVTYRGAGRADKQTITGGRTTEIGFDFSPDLADEQIVQHLEAITHDLLDLNQRLAWQQDGLRLCPKYARLGSEVNLYVWRRAAGFSSDGIPVLYWHVTNSQGEAPAADHLGNACQTCAFADYFSRNGFPLPPWSDFKNWEDK